MTRFRRYFVTGLVVLMPTFISFYVLLIVGEKLDNLLGGAFRGSGSVRAASRGSVS